MEVYILYHNYCNEVESWDSVVDIYADNARALTECNSLQDINSNPWVSYFVIPTILK